MIRVLYSILFFCVFLSVRSYGQTDKEFWFVAPEISNTHVDRPIYLRISAGANDAVVTIEQPANVALFNSGVPMVINVPANTTYSQDLTPWINQIESGQPTPDVIENKGLHITSTEDITVYYEVLGTTGGGVVQNSDIFALKGANALGTTFFTPFQNLLDSPDNAYGSITAYSAFDIVAVYDNTTITITPTQNVVGHAAGVPYTITLNSGQTYSGRAAGFLAAEHLSGTKITSNKAIAVTIKDDSVRQNWALDLVGDQLVPVSVLGSDYIVVKGAVNGNNDAGLYGNSNPNPSFGDRAVICATQNGTTVTIGGVMQTTLSAGQTYNYQVTLPAEYISLSHPAYVFHVSGFGDELGGALLPPIVCTGSRQASVFRDTNEPFYINILVKNGGQGNFSLKNNITGITSSIPSGSFTVVPNTPVAGDWYTASILYNTTDFPAGSSGLVTNSTNDFHCGIINGEATGAGCRYGYFSDFAYVTGGTASANSTPICYNSTATLVVTGSAGNIQWQKSANGVSGWANVVGGSGATTATYTTPAQTSTAYYRAVLTKGTCISAYSTVATVTVNPQTVVGAVSSDDVVCSGSNSGTLTLAGHTGSVVRWERSTNNFATTTTIANVTTSLTYTNITATTKYRAVVKSGVCAAGNSSSATITVDPVSVGGTVSSSATVCSGSNTGTLTLAGHTGDVIRWERSTNNFVTTTSIANVTTSLTYTNIVATTKYRAVVQSGTCAAANSASATITIDPVTVAGTVSSSDTVCSGSNSGTLTLAGNTGSVLRWESSTNNFATSTVIANVTTSQSYTNVATTTKYRAVVQSGTCSAANSASATITVDPVTVAGTVSSSATVCSGSNSGTLTLAGHTGSVVRWERSTDNFVTTTTIANVTTSQTYTNIAATAKYRAVVKSGTCSSANSTAATITVDPVTVAGTVSTSDTVCSGSNSGTLTLAGHTGSVVRWESSTNNFVSTTTIANVTTSQTYTNIAATTKYRAVVKSGTCSSANSTAATITIDPVTVAGTVSSSDTVCSRSNSGTLTLSGNTGSVVRWERSTNNFATTTTIANVTTSQTYTNIAATTKYRAVVKSGTCSAANSTAATITVDPVTVAGTVSASDTVCSGSNSGTLTLAGHTGSVVRWERSTNNFVSTTTIANVTTSQTYTNIAATTKYRAVVKSGTCSSANSTAATITVDPVTVAGTVSSDATVCSGSNSGTLTLAGNTGSVVRWERSTDNFVTTTTIANVTTSQTYTNITATTKYRAVVKSGTCSSANSTAATITIDPVTVAGTVSSDATVCSGSNSGTLTLAGYTGSIVRWESSTNNFVATTTIANVTASQTYTNIAATTKYRAVVKSGTCSSANSASATITIDAPTVAGTVSANATVCSGSNSGTLTLAGKTGSVVRWESSTDNFVTTTSIANVTTSQTYTNVAAATKYRAVVKSGTCASANSTSATISVDAPTDAGTVSSDATVCSGSNSGTLTLAGYTGSIVRWESSTNNFVATTTIANVTASQTYTNIAATTKYRAVVKSGTCSSANSTSATITIDPVSVGGTVSSDATVCSGANSGTLTLAGHTGNVLRWESSTNNFATATTIANVTTSQNYTNLVTATKYRAVVQSGTCAAANSVSSSITLDVPTVAGSVTSDATVCAGGNSGTLTLAGHTGSIVRWESSTDNFATTTNIVNTTTTQNYLNLLVTTKYRAVVQSGTCSSANSASATITIGNITVGGTVSSDATVCSGSNSGTLTLAGHTGSVLQWESSVDNFVTPVVIANATTSQNYLNLVATTKYRALVKSGTCTSAYSSEVEITVGAVSDGGSVNSDVAVCSGVNSGTLTLVSYSGSILNWESSTDNFATSTNIVNTTATQTYTNLAVATKYRAVVQSGICAPANSVAASITIDPTTVAGTVSSDATVCSGSNSGTLTLAGNTGSVVRWESSTDNFATINSIANVTASQTYNNLIAATKYRAIVQSGTCSSANTNEVTISTDAPTLAGTVNSDATVCAGANSGTLTLSGYTGSILNWESSTDNFATTTNIANVSNTQNYLNLLSSTKYRAVVQSGTCAVANSTSATITIDIPTVGGTINSDTSVCSGAHSATLNLVGYTGTIDHWESSSDNFATINTIANTSASQSYTNLTSTTKYHAVITSGVCPSANSADATISIDATTVAGTVSSDSTVCAGSNSGTLNLSGHTGSIVRWESSTDNFVSTTTIANVTATQLYNNIDSTTRYRAVVKSGTCAAVNSTAALITTDAPTVAGTLSSDTTVCYGANSGTLNLVGTTGSIVRWESSTDNFVSAVNISNVASSYSYTNNTATTKYRVVVQSGTCSASNSNTATVTIDPTTLGGSVDTNTTVCFFFNSGTLNLSGQTGSIVGWESSTDNFATTSNIANTSSTNNYTALTATTKFRAVIKSGVCPIDYSTAATITTDAPTVAGTVSSDSTVCSGSNSGTLNLSGYTGSIVRWESSSDNFVSTTTIANTTTAQLYNNLISATKYRAVVKSGTCAEANSTAALISIDVPTVAGTLSSDTTVCSGANSGVLNLVGNTGSVVRWESSNDNFSTVTNISTVDSSYSYTNNTETTKYRVVVQSGTCPASNSNAATVTIDPTTLGGSVGINATVCYFSNSGTLNLSGQRGSILGWESSTDDFATTTPIANTSSTNIFSALTATTKFRAVIKSGVCPIDHSTASTITVDVPSVGGSISSDTTICAGVNSGTLYLSGNTGNVLRWESSDNDFTTVSIVSNATPTLVYSNLTASTKYRAVVKSGACPFTKSNPAIISVDSVSNGGHVTSDITVCLGSNAGTLSLSGNVGSVLYWEQSTDDFATTSPIPNTSNTLVYNDISVPTKYRAVVQSGTCNPANSDSAMISIYPLSVGGQISTSAHACYGNNSGSLTLQNYEGTVQSWEISEDNFANFSTIPNATINQSYSNLVNTTYYRAVVKSGTCPQDISSSAIITVDPTTVPGAVISNTTVCPGSNAGTLALIQHTGSILNWESSTDNFATSNVIANTNIIYNYSSLEDTTWYRASIKSGTCAQAYSTPVKITVLPHALGGEILSDTVVCYGKNLGTLSLKNQRGDLLYWESTTDNFVKSTKLLIYTTTKQYVNLTATTKYRAVLRYGNCPEEKSQPVTVEVDPLFSVNLGADTTICFKKGEWLGSVSNSYPTVLWSNQSTAHNITVKEPGQVWVKVTNNASCSATDTVDLSAYCENVVICFPDVITPNNDAINDNFKPCVEIGGVRSEGSDEVLNENVIFKKFEVHDRWGIKIFESTNKIPKWNGDDLVNSVSAGTFYYYVTFTDMNGVEQEQTGYVTVIK